MARDQSDQRDKIIAELRQQSARRLAEINGLKAAKDRLENDLRAGDTTKQELAQQRTELAQKLDATLSSSQGLQQKLELLTEQSAQDAERAKTLDAKVNDLNRLLHERGPDFAEVKHLVCFYEDCLCDTAMTRHYKPSTLNGCRFLSERTDH